jgi:hypothetical protein
MCTIEMLTFHFSSYDVMWQIPSFAFLLIHPEGDIYLFIDSFYLIAFGSVIYKDTGVRSPNLSIW